ncbi:MAG TPA: diguanylate cyclase [Gemmatimonadales bacterium]|nr:diguanylate cyclase [Gemmatimonadales bacterium]
MAQRTLTGIEIDPVRVLLIEDNPRHARLLENAMGEAGVAFAGAAPYEFSHAPRLSQGLTRLGKGGVDVVLLDLSLPKTSGLEPLQRVRERDPDVPVVALTGLNEDNLAAQALGAGAQDYLTKGKFSASLLARSIRYAVQVRRLQMGMRSLSLNDGLTGLHNRRGFLHLTEPHVKLAQRTKGRFLVVSADVAQLRDINRVAGYEEGDRVLRETAVLLKGTFRDCDLVARIEGSTFAVLAADAALDKRAIIAARVAEHVRRYNGMTVRLYNLVVNLGFAAFDGSGTATIEDLLIQAVADRVGARPRRPSRAAGHARRSHA